MLQSQSVRLFLLNHWDRLFSDGFQIENNRLRCFLMVVNNRSSDAIIPMHRSSLLCNNDKSTGIADQTSHGTWTLGTCSRFVFCIHHHCKKIPKKTKFCQEWHHHKDEDILTYRDKSFASKFTGDEYLTPFLQLLFSYNSSLTTSPLQLFFSFNSSPFPGTQSPVHHTNFMYALDDSLDTFMHQTKK